MKFGDLAQYLEKLEGTSSRLEMTRILADLYGNTTPEDARLIAYLSQGRLGPAYASPDFGVADKMMIRAVASGLGIDQEKVLEVFKRSGDLGLTVEQLKTRQGHGDLSLYEVYDRLKEIASAAGAGSQEKKQSLIGGLLNNLEPRAAKYAVKIILSKLRVGFSDMTVLDSLSWMITGDKSLRSGIEAMYNVRADLGEIAEIIRREKRIEKLQPKTGTPILMARAERAASASEIWDRCGECAVEYKLDGLRVQAHMKDGGVKLFSRGLEDVTAMFPDVVQGLAGQIKRDCIVEGEVIAEDDKGNFLTFQETVQRKRKYNVDAMAEKIPLKFYLFDVLAIEGKSVMDQPNKMRREKLEQLVKTDSEGRIKLIYRITARGADDIESAFAEAITSGTEGIIAKKIDSVYQAGSRNFNWIKYKKSYDKSALADTVDAVVMGYDAGQGKRSGFGIGDFLIGVYQGEKDRYVTVAKIGTGLTDEEWRRMKKEIDAVAADGKPENYEVTKAMAVDVWADPKIVVEIQADEITKSPMHSSGYALRFPRLISWRDKKPEDATSARELEKLYRMQRE